MQALKAFTATFNGCDYMKKKGQTVDDLPPALLATLKDQGLVKEARKEEEAND